MSKRKMRIGVLDVVLILLVLGVILLGIFFISNQKADAAGNSSDTTETVVEYTILFTSLEEERASALSLGDQLFHADSGKLMGQVVAIETQPAFERYYNAETDQIERQDIADAYNISVTLRATVTQNDLGTYIGAAPIMVGARPALQNKYFSASGTCIRLDADGEVSHG